jgi:hypothetical protein
MTEKTAPEVGPIVATSMIAIGVAVVVWAVATAPIQESAKPTFNITTSTGAPSLGLPDEPEPEDPGAVSDTEWEQTLIDVEKLKTDGLIINVEASGQVATVSAEKWNALEEDRRREIGRHLAIYCGRVAGTDRYEVVINDETGAKLGSYQRD